MPYASIERQKEHNREYGKRWYQENKEKKLQQNKIWRQNHPEEFSKYHKKWVSKNRKKYNAIMRKWHKENPEKTREYSKKAYLKNIDGIKEYSQKYQKLDKYKEYRRKYNDTYEARYNRYRWNAKRRKIKFTLTLDEFLMFFWNKDCFYCGTKIKTVGIDRINNNKGYSLDNCVSCCIDCNRMKRTTSQQEFINKIFQIYKHLSGNKRGIR